MTTHELHVSITLPSVTPLQRYPCRVPQGTTGWQVVQTLQQRYFPQGAWTPSQWRLTTESHRPVAWDQPLFGGSTLFLCLLGKLYGGKGGFGSMLRAQGGRMSSKKSTNLDACRDLSGRRLKTIKDAKKMTEVLEKLNQLETLKQEKISQKIQRGLNPKVAKRARPDEASYGQEREAMIQSIRHSTELALVAPATKKIKSSQTSVASAAASVECSLQLKQKSSALSHWDEPVSDSDSGSESDLPFPPAVQASAVSSIPSPPATQQVRSPSPNSPKSRSSAPVPQILASPASPIRPAVGTMTAAAVARAPPTPSRAGRKPKAAVKNPTTVASKQSPPEPSVASTPVKVGRKPKTTPKAPTAPSGAAHPTSAAIPATPSKAGRKPKATPKAADQSASIPQTVTPARPGRPRSTPAKGVADSSGKKTPGRPKKGAK